MTTTSGPRDPEQLEAIQNVVDRVSSYQGSATDGTVEKELTDALTEAGLELDSDEITALAEAIEAIDEGDGTVSATEVLST